MFKHVFSSTVVGLIFSWNAFALNNPSEASACLTGQQPCMAVVDAGSTGSRLHLYSYTLGIGNTPVNIQEVWVKKQSPGLATLSDNPEVIRKYLEDLFDGLPFSTGPKSTKKIPIYFYGTGGMRLLSSEGQRYSLVKTYIQQAEWWDLKDVRTITGIEEGVNGWLALNYQQGLLQPYDTKTSTLAGYMDMGGASVQVVIPVDAKNEEAYAAEYVKLRVYGQDISLFVASFLGLGQTQVTNQFMEKASCYMHGYPMVNKKPGAGNAQQCEESVARLINNVHEIDTIIQPVLSHHAPDKWYVTGGAAHTAKNKLFGLPQDRFTNKDFLEAAGRICASDWLSLHKSDPDNAYLSGYCLFASYYHALMVKGYGLHPEEEIHIPQQDTEWPLGVVLQFGVWTKLGFVQSSL